MNDGLCGGEVEVEEKGGDVLDPKGVAVSGGVVAVDPVALSIPPSLKTA